MVGKRAKILMIACSIVALLVIAVIAAVLSLDVNSYKAKIETAASEATGLDVRINRNIRLSFFPFGLSAQDIHVSVKTGEILSIENLKLGVELMPLLKKELKVTGFELVKPTIIVVKDARGKYNFEGSGKKSTERGTGAVFSMNEFTVSKGSLVYIDRKSNEKTELKDFNLTIKDLSMGGSTGDIIKRVSFTGNMDCKEILQKEFRIENLKAPVKADNGSFSLKPLTIGSLVYTERKSNEKTELKDLHLTIKDLSIGDTAGDITKNISFTGNIDCREVLKKGLKIGSIKSPLKAEDGVFHLTHLTMDIFGGMGEGDVAADMTEVAAVYKTNLKVSNLDFRKLEGSFGTKKMIGGKGELFISLTIKTGRNLMRSMNGNFSLHGDNLVMYTMDLDKVLSRFEETQKFNLVDLGAFFIAGPLGTTAIKGYRYGDLYSQTQGGQGAIRKFVSNWKIRNGVADAMDCALATHHNRIALKGKLDLVSERYNNVIVALLDDKGCAKVKQGISGPLGKPQLGAVSTVESLAGPILNLLSKAKSFIQGGKCEVFYKGSVPQPY